MPEAVTETSSTHSGAVHSAGPQRDRGVQGLGGLGIVKLSNQTKDLRRSVLVNPQIICDA
jgi:hypothetical protein